MMNSSVLDSSNHQKNWKSIACYVSLFIIIFIPLLLPSRHSQRTNNASKNEGSSVSLSSTIISQRPSSSPSKAASSIDLIKSEDFNHLTQSIILLPPTNLSFSINYPFQSNCHLHQKKFGRETPSTLILQSALNDNSHTSQKQKENWLTPSKEEIYEFYVRGKKECEAVLQNDTILNEYFLNYPKLDCYGRPNSQKACRGRGSFYDLTGLIAWPFGPYRACPSYSKCWFGVLTCGELKTSRILETTRPEIETWIKGMQLGSVEEIDLRFPKELKWTLRSLIFHIRVIGTELISPDLRYYPLEISDPVGEGEEGGGGGRKRIEDVLIGQYSITIPDNNYQLEIRHHEFYPSLLYQWSEVGLNEQKFEEYALQNAATVFLGGSEGRCKAWTKCKLSNVCCGCDEKTFIPHSPSAIQVSDKNEICREMIPKELPVCTSQNSLKRNAKKGGSNNFKNPPGRWIHSLSEKLSPNCGNDVERFPSYNIIKFEFPDEANLSSTTSEVLSRRQLKDGSAFYHASGNPCILSHEKEEFGSGHWFYAPYHCKYHFYQREEIMKCFDAVGVTHVHVHGDSISRELFSVISRYMGIKSASESELKTLTNVMKQHNIKFYAKHSGGDGAKVLLSEGYSWDWNLGIMKLIEDPPLPNVFVSNYALAHRASNPFQFRKTLNDTEYQYWMYQRNPTLPLPKYRIYQNAKELHGKKDSNFIGNVFREDSSLVRDMYVNQLDFMELDEFLLSMAKYDNYTHKSDGWNVLGTVRQMETVVLFNMICNDWLTGETKTGELENNK